MLIIFFLGRASVWRSHSLITLFWAGRVYCLPDCAQCEYAWMVGGSIKHQSWHFQPINLACDVLMFLVSRICIKKARTSNGCSLHQTSKLDIPSLQIKRYTGAFTRNRALLGFSKVKHGLKTQVSCQRNGWLLPAFEVTIIYGPRATPWIYMNYSVYQTRNTIVYSCFTIAIF
jgi:hypothetical protein